MKTNKKKGFTLIELIVVIAIIGVLAAILVPSMLGYVKKSKIQGANSTASTLYKAAGSAAEELDEEDKSFADGDIELTKSAEGGSEVNDEEGVKAAIKPFFGEIEKIDAMISFKDGQCLATAVRSGKYYGTYPAVYTAKNWDEKDHGGLDAAIGLAKEEAEGTSSD